MYTPFYIEMKYLGIYKSEWMIQMKGRELWDYFSVTAITEPPHIYTIKILKVHALFSSIIIWMSMRSFWINTTHKIQCSFLVFFCWRSVVCEYTLLVSGYHSQFREYIYRRDKDKALVILPSLFPPGMILWRVRGGSSNIQPRWMSYLFWLFG